MAIMQPQPQDITLKARELCIKTITSKKTGEQYEVAQIRSSVAFDDGFINDLKAAGVQVIVNQDEEKEE